MQAGWKCFLIYNMKSMWHSHPELLGLYGLLLAFLPDQRLVDVRDHTWVGRKRPRITKPGKETDECRRPDKHSPPPPAMVALINESSSSSPLMASCRWRGVIRFTFRSLDAFPANSSTLNKARIEAPPRTPTEAARLRRIVTSAVRYSRMAALYTAAVAPTRPWLVVLDFRCLWIRPTGNCSESRERNRFAFKLRREGGGFHKCRYRGDDKPLPGLCEGKWKSRDTNLQSCSLGARNSLCLGLPRVFPCFSSGLENTHSLNPQPPQQESAGNVNCSEGNCERRILDVRIVER